MRILAIIAAHNEERFIGGCLQHLFSQGVEAYLCDDGSTDETASIAARFLGQGLRGLERLPRDGVFRWRRLLAHKAEVASRLDADWFLHLDADEEPLPPRGHRTLATALEAVDASGYNAVELSEFTFVPTREAPDHDHPEYRRTMRWYYPFAPSPLHLVRAWKRQPAQVDLASTGGHVVDFPDRRLFPERFRLRHYIMLSRAHALRKYEAKTYDPAEVADGWHAWRPTLQAEAIVFPPQALLRTATSDDELDASSPRDRHFVHWPTA